MDALRQRFPNQRHGEAADKEGSWTYVCTFQPKRLGEAGLQPTNSLEVRYSPTEELRLHWAGGRKWGPAWPLMREGGLHANKLLAATAPRGEVTIDPGS